MPRTRPIPGLCVPCAVTKVRDGDTVEVTVFGGAYTWAIRLIDCWVNDKDKAVNAAARDYLKRWISGNTEPVYLHIPLPRNTDNLLKNLTFDRIPGYVFIGERTINETMVLKGFATKTKPKK